MDDLKTHNIRLPAQTLALFEVSSGLMVLNVNKETFFSSVRNFSSKSISDQDLELYTAINHETYHYFQTLATGYQYHYASEVWRLIVEESEKYLQERERKSAGIKQKIKKAIFRFKRFSTFNAMVEELKTAHTWESQVDDDYSLLAAQLPALAAGFERLWQGVVSRGDEGLSAEDIIEGTAIIYQYLLTYGSEGLSGRLAEVWKHTDEKYRLAFDKATEVCGDRALDIILPASALALRYSKPPGAFTYFLKALVSSERGNEIEFARTLGLTPPPIASAGEYLGTATDVRARQLAGGYEYPVYEAILDQLAERTWGFDEITLLSDHAAGETVDQFPFVTLVREGVVSADLDSVLTTKRLLCASLVLRTEKLPRYRRHCQQKVLDRLQPIFTSISNPEHAGEQYLQLGLGYLKEQDFEHAEIVFDRALSLFRSQSHVSGSGWALYNLGVTYGNQKRKKRAETAYRNALQLGEEVEDLKLIAMSANNLGNHLMKYYATRKLHEANDLIQRSLGIACQLDNRSDEALYRFNLGRIYLAWNQREKARDYLTESLRLYRDTGDREMTEWIEAGLADLQ